MLEHGCLSALQANFLSADKESSLILTSEIVNASKNLAIQRDETTAAMKAKSCAGCLDQSIQELVSEVDRPVMHWPGLSHLSHEASDTLNKHTQILYASLCFL